MADTFPKSSPEAARWATALLASIGINGIAFLVFATVMGREWVKQDSIPLPSVAQPHQVVAVIRPEMIRPEVVQKSGAAAPAAPVAPPPSPPPQGFLRTSSAQESDAPTQAKFFGERNTRATSDAAPVAGAPAVPSQSGREPSHPQELETTESRYHEGDLAANPAPQPPPSPNASSSPESLMPAQPPAPELADPALASQSNHIEPPQTPQLPLEAPPKPQPIPSKPTPSDEALEIKRATENKRIRETLKKPEGEEAKHEAQSLAEAEHIRQEELPKPLEPKPPEQKKSLPDSPPAPDKASTSKPQAKPASSAPIKDPAFRGYQQKTKLRGSIARQGTSAMDVVDSPLGKYHAQLSRAIEKEWQLNCKRYRDNIIPGSMTLSFLIDPDKGTIKSITFVDVFKGSEIQKGFTIKSIRDAEIPAIPKAVREELDGEPLEVTYSFHF